MKHVRTSKYTNERWAITNENVLKRATVHIEIDPSLCFQTMVGFGGAFTEASGYNLSRININQRTDALKAYFDPINGLGYQLGRVSIHSCDFSLGSFTYVDDYDESLSSFSIKRDHQYVIPMILDAMKIAKTPINILASPWTPVWWMKNNQSPIRGGTLLPKYYDLWADYMILFMKEYEKAGIPIWGISCQNEPMAVQRWDSCIYTSEEERDFVKHSLGPKLHQANMQHVKLLVWDHNRDLMVERAKVIYQDAEAAKYIWGTAFHWYVSEDFSQVGITHDLFPDKHLLFTEGCQEGGPHFGVWETGERYGRNMIGDFNHWTEGYIDWNLFLDDTGGPNHVNNLCDAPVMIKVFAEEIVYQSSYYYIGHFSRYIQPGAKRIASSIDQDAIKMVAFMNPNQEIVIVAQNDTEEDFICSVLIQDKMYQFNAIKRSINTIIF